MITFFYKGYKILKINRWYNVFNKEREEILFTGDLVYIQHCIDWGMR